MLDLPIVDAHHHLWDLRALRYPWLMARGVRRFFGDPTPIQRDYLVGDLLADAADVPLVKSVHVQVGVADEDAVAETRWLQEVSESAGSRGLPNAIVAYCDLASPSAAEMLAAHRASPNLRGIRQIVGRAPHDEQQARSDALIDDPAWLDGLRRLADLDLSFDLQMIPSQALRLARRLERVPALRVAVCHAGSPWVQDAAGLAAWRAGLRALAALPRVWCKLSGFGMFDPYWDAAGARVIVDAAVEAFGVRRCMFGSNFPVEKLVTDYRELWRRYDVITAARPEAERRRLFGESAAEFYRLGAV